MSLPLAIFYYDSMVGHNNETTRLAWTACSVLLPFSFVLLGIFFINIKTEYRKTFYSLKRGRDVTVGHMDSDKDSIKALVFIKNRQHWRSIEDKVEKWVHENWERWMEEKPEWLNDNMKARIPSDMIPNIKDRRVVEELQSERRRSSLLGRISVRRRSSLIGAEKVTPE